ncbi:MAG TPA: AraC family transcriptional regulator [Planctomycetota bacterium]|nr:AraC family transcriptional regulator [Planctomycetota bacterium]
MPKASPEQTWDRAACLLQKPPEDAWTRALERGLSALPVLYELDEVSVGDQWAERFHATPTHELIQVRQGHARIELRKRTFDVGPGDVFIIPQGTPHKDIRAKGEDYRALYVFFRAPGLEKSLRELGAGVPFKNESARMHLQMMLKELEDEYRGESAGAPQRMRVTLLEILLALLRYAHHRYSPDPEARRALARRKRNDLMRRVHDYLVQHCAEPIGLEGLALHFDVSPFHLCRGFSQEYGIALFEMLAQIRIQRAKDFLVRGGVSMKEIARQTGFANGNYFAKVFRRATGLSPSEYQLSLRQKR